jgi:hypothetical protein
MTCRDTSAETVATLRDRITALEAENTVLRTLLGAAEGIVLRCLAMIDDLGDDNAELRQDIDTVTDREREGRGWSS